MKKQIVSFLTVALFFLNSCSPRPAADIKLPKIFGDHMVLQRDCKIKVFGTADPKKRITVAFNNNIYSAISDNQGKWMLEMKPENAGGPYTMQVYGKDTITFTDVLVGEVWICSGQSNMHFDLQRDKNAATELPVSDNANIRLIKLETTNSLVKKQDVPSQGWNVCNAESAKAFSAVGYYYGKNLQENLNVPIGLIESAWGGSCIEAWMCADTLKKYTAFKTVVDLMEKKTAQGNIPSDSVLDKIYKEKVALWEAKVNEVLTRDEKSDAKILQSSTAKWKKMRLPRQWESTEIGTFDGIVWFVKKVSINKKWMGKKITLKLGSVDDMDVTYVNGKKVGSMLQYNENRVYEIPASEVKPEMQIAVKVIDVGGGGGFNGPASSLYLVCGKDSVSLSGEWAYSISSGLEKFPLRPAGAVAQQIPFTIYNAMIHPLVPYNIKGAIWYQGESNADRAFQYRSLMKSMINNWRTAWGSDLAFIIIQLPNYKDQQVVPGESDWAEMRESMFMATQMPAVGISCNIELGEANNIHPTDKAPVGYRAALVALNQTYKMNIEYSGPRLKAASFEGNKAVVTYDHIAKGLKYNGKLKGFAIAAEDQKFYWANATLKDSTVILSCPQVKKPVAVRYNWSDNPEGNLYNSEALPAFPFRTDQWQKMPVKEKSDLILNLEKLYQ